MFAPWTVAAKPTNRKAEPPRASWSPRPVRPSSTFHGPSSSSRSPPPLFALHVLHYVLGIAEQATKIQVEQRVVGGHVGGARQCLGGRRHSTLTRSAPGAEQGHAADVRSIAFAPSVARPLMSSVERPASCCVSPAGLGREHRQTAGSMRARLSSPLSPDV